MSINITGPRKYDFQDLVCVHVALRFLGRDDAVLLVEPSGGEDCELRLADRSVEIQVKGAAGQAGLKEIAAHLAHTPPHASHGTLLERLVTDETRFVVLVLSARCDDASSPLVRSTEWEPEKRKELLTLAASKALLEEFKKPSSSLTPTTLDAARDRHRADVAAALPAKNLRAALGRLIVVERLDDASLNAACRQRLTGEHRVPWDRLQDTVNRIVDAVKTAKGNGTDVLDPVRQIMREIAELSLRPAGYIDRGDEPAWSAALSQDRALLLTGAPRTGKSETARAQASLFQDNGYQVRMLSDVQEAERFLSEPGPAQRLVLLDDPLGGAHTEPDAGRRYGRLEDLIGRLRPNRRLVVAQSQEQLLQTVGRSAVGLVRTAGLPWYDLGTPGPFLGAIWQSEAAAAGVPTDLRQFVAEALAAGTLRLVAGSIRHLATHFNDVRKPFTPDGIERIAHQAASSLAMSWKQEGLQPLARSIAIGTTPSQAISLGELAFLMGKGGEKLPGLVTSAFTVTYIGAPSSDPGESEPDYEAPPELDDPDRDRLDVLESRRLITFPSGDMLNFTHPYYRVAGETSATGPTKMQADAAQFVLRRALFCNSPSTSRAAAGNLDWLHDGLVSQNRPEIVPALAEQGLRSYFPATRDGCFAFLVRQLDAFDENTQSRLPKWVASVKHPDVGTMQWRAGEAWMPSGRAFSFEERLEGFFGPEKDEVRKELDLLEQEEGGYLTSEGAGKAVLFYRRNPADLGHRAMERLLNYGEGFIRAGAAEAWMKVDRSDDGDILRRLGNDEHPAVAASLLDGSVRGWPVWGPERRAGVARLLSNIASSPSAAAAMMDNLVRFDRVEYSGKVPPWDLFAAVMPIALSAVPTSADFMQARLFNVMAEASAEIAPEFLVTACDSWISWLERLTSAGDSPDDYALGIADILIRGTKRRPELRSGRIARLLGMPGTTVPYAILGDLAEDWERLAPEERDLVRRMITTNRADLVWLQAAVLTSRLVPLELQHLVLPEGPELGDGPQRLLTELPAPLLHACIHAYTGRIPRLWDRAHRNADIWAPVVALIARDSDHDLFATAWDEVSASGNQEEAVANLILDSGPAHAEMFLDLMIRRKVGRTGDFIPRAWTALLTLAPDRDVRDRWLLRALEFVTAILDDLEDLAHWLSDDDDVNIALEYLQPDLHALVLSRSIVDGGKPSPSVTAALSDRLKQSPPRLHGTYGRLQRDLELAGVDDPALYGRIEALRLGTLEAAEALRNAFDAADERPRADGWIEP